MSELRTDVWPEDPAPSSTPRRPGRPPAINIKTWLECFERMAALLVSRFPEKGPELWAYQSTILNAAHSYDGATWVAHDRQYRREMLDRKDLNWSVPNSRLYNEAFTGRARIMPRCQHWATPSTRTLWSWGGSNTRVHCNSAPSRRACKPQPLPPRPMQRARDKMCVGILTLAAAASAGVDFSTPARTVRGLMRRSTAHRGWVVHPDRQARGVAPRIGLGTTRLTRTSRQRRIQGQHRHYGLPGPAI